MIDRLLEQPYAVELCFKLGKSINEMINELVEMILWVDQLFSSGTSGVAGEESKSRIKTRTFWNNQKW